MNKNAYEIRLSILQMAHGDLMAKYQDKVGTLRYNAERKQESHDPQQWEEFYPTPAEILARADELYKFVDSK